MILEHIFKVGMNEAQFNLSIDLSKIRKYSKVAEFEAQMMESIDEDITLFFDTFNMKLKIEGFQAKLNFEQQIEKLKKESIETVHYSNMIYLLTKIEDIEKKVFTDHADLFVNISIELSNLKTLINYALLDDVSKAKLTFYKVNNELLSGIEITQHVVSDILLPIVKHGLKKIKRLYRPIFKIVFGKEIKLKKITINDLEDIIANINHYINSNLPKGFKQYYLMILLSYIRENKILGLNNQNNMLYPTSREARLIYFLLCITGFRKVMLDAPKLEKDRLVNKDNQNDKIINQIIGEYKKHKSPIASKAHEAPKILEYYLPLLKK